MGFVRDASMEFKLTNDASLLQPEFPGASTGDANDPAFGGIENSFGSQAAATAGPSATGPAISAPPLPALPQLDTSLLANYDLGNELTAVPSNAETVIATVSAKEFLEAFKASSRFEFFRAQDGSTFVNMGVLFQRKDLYGDLAAGVSNLRVYASVSATGDAKDARYASNETSPGRVDLSEHPVPGGIVESWTGLALPPGRYKAVLAIEDSLTGRLGRTSGEFEVPDFSAPGLQMSTLVFASELSDSEGRLSVKTSRSSAKFRRSESFGVYFEVYGLKEAAGSFDVSYQFYRDASGTAVKIGQPIVFEGRTQAAQGWAVPLEKWPTGRYRIEVTVSTPAGESASTLEPFEVLEDLAAGNEKKMP